jgi:DNA polymerase-3 subunit gamma/tau
MSYVIFALKYRPKNFDEVIGQDHITITLKNAILSGRLAQAYLFSGPRGVGKTSVARILAKSLNCIKGLTVSPCEECLSCKEISEARSLDVLEIDGASNRGIDEVRQLRENVKFSPVRGRFKIYIIDEVHMLTQEAFNALLKTLEEPPTHVKFIFATTQPHKVIPTILSRCQRFDFHRISVRDIVSQLERIVKLENLDVEEEVLITIAKNVDGSLRDAESLLEQLLSFSNGRISLKDVSFVLGVIEEDSIFEITEKIARCDLGGALRLFSSLIEQGKDINNFIERLLEHFRNLMIIKATGNKRPDFLDISQDSYERLKSQSQSFSLEKILFCFNTFLETKEVMRRFELYRIPVEFALAKLTQDAKLS